MNLYRLTRAFTSRVSYSYQIIMIWLKYNLKIKTVYVPLQDHTTKTIISMFFPFLLFLFLLKDNFQCLRD